MNMRPLTEAMDNDLRLSQAALDRAALRARKLAAQTGTDLVFSHDGVIERVPAGKPEAELRVQEPETPYGNKK